LALTSANISSLSTGLVVFFIGRFDTKSSLSSISTGFVIFFVVGRFDRKSSLSSSNDKAEDFVVAFVDG